MLHLMINRQNTRVMVVKPYLDDVISRRKESGKWKNQLTVNFNFISIGDNNTQLCIQQQEHK